MSSFSSTPTLPNSSLSTASYKPPLQHRPFSDPNRLAPEDAFFAHSPPRLQRESDIHTRSSSAKGDTGHSNVRKAATSRRRGDKERGRSGSRRRKREWTKLLWVKQACTLMSQLSALFRGSLDVNLDPDNYTDPPTFLSHLQRNPRLLPYDFWPLVADSTVIVQHISSVAIFVCCFVGIIQERISPVSVVGCGSVGTVLGWVLWDFWVGQQEAAKVPIETLPIGNGDASVADAGSGASSSLSINLLNASSQSKDANGQGLGLTLTTSNLSRGHSHSHSQTSIPSASSGVSPTLSSQSNATPNFPTHIIPPTYDPPSSSISLRNQQRLATAKSAILIYCALLGLSPILKSLTKSTTSDSIWAMSCWLMCINIFFFDYGGGVGVKWVPYFHSSISLLNQSSILCMKTVLNSTTDSQPPFLPTRHSWPPQCSPHGFPLPRTYSLLPYSASKFLASSPSSGAICGIFPGAATCCSRSRWSWALALV